MKSLATAAYPNRFSALYAINVNSAVMRAYGMVKRFLSDGFKRKVAYCTTTTAGSPRLSLAPVNL